MPNIMLFGFDQKNYYNLAKRLTTPRSPVHVLITQIEQAMKSISLDHDAVVTNVPYSTVESLDGKRTHKPYIRICSTNGMKELRQIADALIKNGIRYDIELLPLPKGGFIPVETMKT